VPPGGFGVVLEALSTISGESVAIKRIPLSNVRPEDLESVLDELRLLQRLSHPNIVQVRTVPPACGGSQHYRCFTLRTSCAL
jgi:serine/threonine protein kinase